MKSFLNYCLVLYLISLMTTSCNDREVVNTPIDEPATESKFIWNTMHNYYLWNDKIETLNIRIESRKWYNYLNQYRNKNQELFNSLLYKEDKWSFVIEDYEKYKNYLEGTHLNFGFEFDIIKKDGKDTAVVLYVTPGTPAESAGLKRGDSFNKINGKQISKENYKGLLFSKNECILNIIKPLPKNLTIQSTTKIAPAIFKHLAYDVNGTKVGYILYNAFVGENAHHRDLNNIIKELKDNNITELVLDLRYNGGGSVYNASLLGSMLAKKQFAGKIFTRREYNKALAKAFSEQNREDAFYDKITTQILDTETLTSPIAEVNNLELSRVFILVSQSTASASEVLINGLKPYMDVVLIGTQTYGKNVGSSLIQDQDENGKINTTHKCALQPIIMKFYNANAEGDYSEGFTPKYVRDEHKYYPEYLPLGDPEEYLFRTALDIIRGNNVPFTDTRASVRCDAYTEITLRSVDYKALSHKATDNRILKTIH